MSTLIQQWLEWRGVYPITGCVDIGYVRDKDGNISAVVLPGHGRE